MKRIAFLGVLILLLAAAAPASAHYLWLDPVGEISATPGDTISVDAYLHFETDDVLQMWGLTLGFDDAAVDGAGLTYQSITYGSTILGSGFSSAAYSSGTSSKHAGESEITGVSRFGFPGQPAEGRSAGDDFLLFTAYFTFNGDVWDGEDVWIEFDEALDGIGMASAMLQDLDALYTDGDAPDYAHAPGTGRRLAAGLRADRPGGPAAQKRRLIPTEPPIQTGRSAGLRARRIGNRNPFAGSQVTVSGRTRFFCAKWPLRRRRGCRLGCLS